MCFIITAVEVQSGWSKQVFDRTRSSSLPGRNADWEGAGEEGANTSVLKAEAEADADAQIQGPTAAVSVSRLFFENKVKEIADSISLSPRGSLTLPKRDWGYSPYATPPKRAVYSSLSLSSLEQSDECSTSTSADSSRQRDSGREVVSLGNFAERKAFFQGSTAGSGHIVAASTANTDGCPSSSVSPPCMRAPEGHRGASPRQQQQRHRDRDRDYKKDLNIITAAGSASGLESEGCVVKSVKDIVRSWSTVVREASVVKSKKNDIVSINQAMTARDTQLHFVRMNEVAII